MSLLLTFYGSRENLLTLIIARNIKQTDSLINFSFAENEVNYSTISSSKDSIACLSGKKLRNKTQFKGRKDRAVNIVSENWELSKQVPFQMAKHLQQACCTFPLNDSLRVELMQHAKMGKTLKMYHEVTMQKQHYFASLLLGP